MCGHSRNPCAFASAAHLGRRSSAARHPGRSRSGASAAPGVLEVVDDHDGDTYRAVYTVRFAGAVYVIHAFQKKSKSGIATPRHEIALIERRLQRAREDHEQWLASTKTTSR